MRFSTIVIALLASFAAAAPFGISSPMGGQMGGLGGQSRPDAIASPTRPTTGTPSADPAVVSSGSESNTSSNTETQGDNNSGSVQDSLNGNTIGSPQANDNTITTGSNNPVLSNNDGNSLDLDLTPK